MDLINIGKRIRRQREYLGYSREVFAEKLDVTPKFCSDIELGVKGMSVKTLCKMCEILGLSADYILFGRDGDSDTTAINELINSCPNEKRVYLESIVKTFICSIDK